MASRLLLVRHGETQWHAENRYAGISDVALTEKGLRQARDLGTWARQRGVDAVACSPVSRARLTAEPAAELLGVEPEIVEGLREVDFGWGEGRTIAEMAAEDPEAVRRFLKDAELGAFAGSEPPSEAAARASTALRGLARRHPDGTVLVVAHNTLLRMALCAMLSIPVGRYRLVFPRLDNAAVTEIEVTDAGTGLRSLNVPTWAPLHGRTRNLGT
ncbi:phosphoglycerate mutase [Streptomyces agglomeratus]|uniref:Phosphoglycerate mutase n=1 Tax=Streptomyces agglomeratus TaxID=285458 RepID=A0A1E5P2E6_9ACTN|nr:histidine phosphatase family protein [Streptomyces agglomeratus]OEJ23728.1 phosphoglycerate mutase [Streptomyces agglomeratus]OEJ43320.1 phosphoglycerate mutase [Streptomyces agglomeratus]OEJ54762.1 phosphoglycerate mutase [Streptomyces agglomeratus]